MRVYKCIHTGKKYTCTYNSDLGTHTFIDENGKELKEYLSCGFDGVEYKFSDNSVIRLGVNDLINLHLVVGKPTHKRYAGFKRFTTIKTK